MPSKKYLPTSDVNLISNGVKCKWRCIRDTTRNIPRIANLYHDSKKEMSIPLENINLNVEILNSSADIKFSQTFKNESENPIECIYKFPSDAAYTIVGLEVKIGDNIINTKIMEKEQAKQKYDDAVASGNTAVKLNFDEKLPDVIELNVGQLQPGDTALVTVSMIAELEVIKHGFYSFIFPLNFFPLIGDEKKNWKNEDEPQPAEFNASIKVQSSSIITNLDVSHKGFAFEQSEDRCVFLKFQTPPTWKSVVDFNFFLNIFILLFP